MVSEARSHDRTTFEKPLPARFGSTPVFIKDAGATGVRVEHVAALMPGEMATLTYQLHQAGKPMSVPGRVVWTHIASGSQESGRRFESGIQAGEEAHLLGRLLNFFRGQIELALPDEELDIRRLGRLLLEPPVPARLGITPVTILDVSYLGVRIRHAKPLSLGHTNQLSFTPPGIHETVTTRGTVVWIRLESFSGQSVIAYVSGLEVAEPQGLADALLLFQAYGVAKPDTSALHKKRSKLVERLSRRR